MAFAMLAVFEMNVTCSKSPTSIDVIFHNQYMSTFVIPINLLIAFKSFLRYVRYQVLLQRQSQYMKAFTRYFA